jgi:hypothetical protein
MNRKLRAIAVLILCGIILYNSMGYMLVYSFNRMVLRDQVFSNLSSNSDNNLTSFTISKSKRDEVFSSRKQLEIKVEGQMYDVVRYKDDGNSITYYCLRDHKEEQLIAKSIFLKDQSKSTTSFPKTARLILDQMLKIALLSEKIVTAFSAIPSYFSTTYIYTYSVPVIPVPAPPPQPIC